MPTKRQAIRLLAQPTRGFPAGRGRLTTDAVDERLRDDPAMSYAVVWNEDDGSAHAGRLELAGDTVELTGVALGRREAHRTIPNEQLANAHIERARSSRLVGLPTVVLDLRAGGRLRIASIQGPGSLTELAELLQERCASAVDRDPADEIVTGGQSATLRSVARRPAAPLA